MPDGDEAVIDEVAVDDASQINLLDPAFQEEMKISLTRGQSIFVYRILEANIRPQGFEMIEFSMDLLNRFKTVLESEPTPTVTDGPVVIGGGTPDIEAFKTEQAEKAAETGTSFDMSPKNPLGE
jgi:hypothetical protein